MADNSSGKAWGHKLTEKYAKENSITFRGALPESNKLEAGCYYAGPVISQQKDIIESAKKFDKIVLLDQTQEVFF